MVFVPMSYFCSIKSKLKMTIILLSLVDSVSHGFGRGGPLGGSRSQRDGQMAAGAGTSGCWRGVLLRGPRASPCGLSGRAPWASSQHGGSGRPRERSATWPLLPRSCRGGAVSLSPYSIGDRSATGLPRFTGKGIRFQFLVGERKVPEELLGWKMLQPSWQVQSSGLAWGKPATLLWPTCSPSI